MATARQIRESGASLRGSGLSRCHRRVTRLTSSASGGNLVTSLSLIPLEDIEHISFLDLRLNQSKPSYRYPNTGGRRLISRQEPRPAAGQAFHRDHAQN